VSNSFFVWPPGAASAVQFEPQEYLRTGTLSDMSYFSGVLDAVDRTLSQAGITFLVTWNIDAFDPRFEDAVVLLIGDERYQTPSYADRVRAIFKTGGLRANPLQRTLSLPCAIAWRVILRDMRNRFVALRRRGIRRSSYPAQYEIPLGTFHLIEVPFVPIEARAIDVFFAGTAPKLSRADPRPSVASRLRLKEAICEAEAALPAWRFEHALTRTDRVLYSAEEYSSKMMNARIVPCPRGNFDETFRLFEAAKSGCVIVSEPLPDRWYYRNAPVIQIKRWSALRGVLQELDREPARVSELSVQTRRWWNETLSEPAVARFIAAHLDSSVEPGR
jgi:hypothetical protein